MSAAYADKGSGQLRQRSLWEGLGLNDRGSILAWRDSLTGLEYLRRAHDLADRGLPVDLHAYQCYVFLDWREIYATADKSWDRLCDQLAGRGVPSLDDAMANLELRPVHDAIRAALDPAIVRLFADAAEVPHAPGAPAEKKTGKKQAEFLDTAWGRTEALVPAVQAAWSRFAGQRLPVPPMHPDSLAPIYRKCIRAAMRLSASETLFPTPWDAAARHTLPNSSPRLPATALWGPVLAWCLLYVLAESVSEENPELIALDLFNRLRLRESFAHSFNALGLDGEEGWRASARLKVLLQVRAALVVGAGKESKFVRKPTSEAGPLRSSSIDAAAEALASEASSKTPMHAATAPKGEMLANSSNQVEPDLGDAKPRTFLVPPALWQDPDVRWLTGFNEAEGHAYVNREAYEELLWWLHLPDLFKLVNMAVPTRSAAAAINTKVVEAITELEKAGYRVDALLKSEDPATTPPSEKPATSPSQPDAAELVSVALGSKSGSAEPEPAPEELEPEEPVAAKPVGPKNPQGPPENY